MPPQQLGCNDAFQNAHDLRDPSSIGGDEPLAVQAQPLQPTLTGPTTPEASLKLTAKNSPVKNWANSFLPPNIGKRETNIFRVHPRDFQVAKIDIFEAKVVEVSMVLSMKTSGMIFSGCR